MNSRLLDQSIDTCTKSIDTRGLEAFIKEDNDIFLPRRRRSNDTYHRNGSRFRTAKHGIRHPRKIYVTYWRVRLHQAC